LSGATISAEFPAAVLIAGYNLGLLTAGVNTIPGTMDVTVLASGTAEGSRSFQGLVISGETTITDPDGTPGNGDETATPLVVTVALPTSQWTPTGGDIGFSDGGSLTTASVFNGRIKVSFTCEPGTSAPAGCVSDAAVDCTARSAVAAAAFVVSAQGGTPASTTSTTSTTTTTTVAATTTAATDTSTTTTQASTSVGSGTSNFTMTCTNNVTPEVSTMNWTARGTSLSSFNAGDSVPLRNQRWNLTIGGSIFDAGINFKLIKPGDSVQSNVDVKVNATNTAEGSKTSTGMPFTVVVEVDDAGKAKDATASFFIPDTTWTATGGAIVWTPDSAEIRVTIASLPNPVVFKCDADAGTNPILDTSAPQVLGESLAFTGTRGGGPLLPIAISLILLDLGYMAWSTTRPDRRKFL